MITGYYTRLAKKEDIKLVNSLIYLSKAYWGYDVSQMEKFKKELLLEEEWLNDNQMRLLFLEDQLVGCFSFIYDELFTFNHVLLKRGDANKIG